MMKTTLLIYQNVALTSELILGHWCRNTYCIEISFYFFFGVICTDQIQRAVPCQAEKWYELYADWMEIERKSLSRTWARFKNQ